METISNELLTVGIAEHGAELQSMMRGGREYLWHGDPSYWKRRSPVLFPIVGSVWNNTYYVENRPYKLTQHGFARDMDFELVSEKADEVRYRLTDNEETHEKYPFPFCLEIGYRLKGNAVEVMWEVTNPSDGEIHFQIGAHPAFYYPGFKPEDTRRGFFGFDRKDGLEYLLVAEKGCVDIDKRYPLRLDKDGFLPIDTHTFDKDALILEDSQVKEVTLYDNEKRPYVTLRFDAPVVGLWSPPAKNAPFVCIEPWYGRCDRVCYVCEFKDKDWMQHLPAHGTFRGRYVIEIK